MQCLCGNSCCKMLRRIAALNWPVPMPSSFCDACAVIFSCPVWSYPAYGYRLLVDATITKMQIVSQYLLLMV